MSANPQVALVKNNWEFCDLCQSRTNIEWKCVHCCQIFCHQCRNLHVKGNITMHHFIFNKSEEEKENYWNSVYKCKDHENRNVQFYCNVDKVKICEICIVEDHKRHDFESIVQFADDFRRKFQNILSAGQTDENEADIYNNITTEEDIHLCRKAEQYNFHDWNKLAENFQMFLSVVKEYTKKIEEIQMMKSEIEKGLDNVWDVEIVHMIEELETKVKVLQDERASAESMRDKVNALRTSFQSLKLPASHMLKAVETSQAQERVYYTEEIAKLERELEGIQKEKQKMKEDLKDFVDKKKIETQQIKQTEKKLKDEKARVSNLEKKMKTTEKEMQAMERELKEFAQKNADIQLDRADQSVKISRLEENSQQLVIQNSNLKSSIKDLESKLTHQTQLNVDKENMMRQMKYELQRKDREIADLKANKETLLTRLSKVAGENLAHDNASTTDLSDPNRPTKIAEKFSELYDNEWTDALEELVAANVNEKSSILFLKDSLMKSFRLCSETARKQTIESRRCFEELPTPDSEDLKICSAFSDHKLSLDTIVKKEIDRIRKELAPSTASLVQKRFKVILEEHLRIFLESQATITGHEAVQESIQEKPFQTEKQSSPESKYTMQLKLPVSTKPGSLSRSFSSPSSEEAEPVVNLSKSMYTKLPPPEILIMADLQQRNENPECSEIILEDKQSDLVIHNSRVHHARDINNKDQVTGNISTTSDGRAGEDNSKVTEKELAKEDLLKPDGQTGEDNSKIKDEAPAKQDLPNPDQPNTASTQSLEIRFQKLFNYSRKCVSLCWFMRSPVQNFTLKTRLRGIPNLILNVSNNTQKQVIL